MAEQRNQIDQRIREVRAAASGRWVDVLARIGLPEISLTKRNKPCPVCGGTDRFSFISTEAKDHD